MGNFELTIYDGREKSIREWWGFTSDSPNFIAFVIEGEQIFHNTQFLKNLFSKYHSSKIFFWAENLVEKRIMDIENQLSTTSIISDGFLNIFHYSDSLMNQVVNISEQLGRWEIWCIGFLNEKNERQLLNACKQKDLQLGTILYSEFLDFLAIRNFDMIDLSIFTYRDDTFIEFQRFIENELIQHR